MAKNKATFSALCRLLQEANKQEQPFILVSFGNVICELILFVSDFWKGSQTTERFKQSHLPPSATRVKSQGGETVFQVRKNCAVNFILTKQGKNKWKPSCKHPNHIINFKWAQNFLDTQAKGDPCRKPRVSDFRAHWTSVRAESGSKSTPSSLTQLMTGIKEQDGRCYSMNINLDWPRI